MCNKKSSIFINHKGQLCRDYYTYNPKAPEFKEVYLTKINVEPVGIEYDNRHGETKCAAILTHRLLDNSRIGGCNNGGI